MTPVPTTYTTLLPPVLPAETTASFTDDVSGTSASRRSSQPTSLHWDFSLVMTIAVGRVGLLLPPLLPPKSVSCLHERFYSLLHPAQAAFIWPPLPDIWHCVEVSWQQPLQTIAPVVGLVNYFRVQSRTESSYPSIPPLDVWQPTCLCSQLGGQREGGLCHSCCVTKRPLNILT